MVTPIKILPLCLILWSNVAVVAQSRIWTNDEGDEIEAEMVSADATEVLLKMTSSGKQYSVPIARLSDGDARYIEERLKRNPGDAKGKAPGYENWDVEWPKLISGEVSLDVDVVVEDEENKRYVYRSPHYEYVCDVKLSKNVVNRFAVLFEATNEFVRALPLSMEKAHQKERHLILLFEHQETYFSKGGPEGSAGVYIGGKDVIMVPLTSLGVIESAGGYRVDYDRTNKTLPHEIVHQLTDKEYYAPGARGWFTEGLAEYIAVTPYRSGKFVIRGSRNAVKAYATAYGENGTGGRALGEHIQMPPIKDYFLQDYKSFVDNASKNYGVGLLLAYHFFHWDGEGDAGRIKEFLKGLKQGKRGEQALEVLLDGRTYDELEEDISRAWRARGVRLDFQ